MRERHAGAVGFRREGHVDLGLPGPVGIAPTEHDPTGWVADRHATDLELVAVDEALEEPTADARLQVDLLRSVSSV